MLWECRRFYAQFTIERFRPVLGQFDRVVTCVYCAEERECVADRENLHDLCVFSSFSR